MEADLRTFARHWSNFGLRQFAQAFVPQDDVLAESIESGRCESTNPRICPGWYKIKQHFENQPSICADDTIELADLSMYRMLDSVEMMLRSNYTAVGILEEWDTSMLLFSEALRMPGWDWEKEFNSVGAQNTNLRFQSEKDIALEKAWFDPEIRRILWLDILLYDLAVTIFNEQVQALHYLN